VTNTTNLSLNKTDIFGVQMKTNQKSKYSINVDTIEFFITGMDFKNPSSFSAELIDEEDGVVIAKYGNRVFMNGNGGIHRMSVRMMNSGKELHFSGSPFACVRKQNLYTSDDVVRGCRIAIKKAMKQFGINPPSDLLRKWLTGDVILKRVDLAVNFRLSSKKKVIEVLRQLRDQLIGRNASLNIVGHSVCWNPRSGKQYSMVFYPKGVQLRSSGRYKKHPYLEELVGEAENILRVELRLRSSELRLLSLSKASDWNSEIAREIFLKYFSKLKFLSVTSGVVTEKELSKLPSRLRVVLALHKSGVNLRQIFHKRTLQRHMSHFRGMGIDLRVPNQQEGVALNLCEILSVKRAVSAAPDWMVKAGMARIRKLKRR
jgi:II/X family phage/plasmid replication protein